MHILMTDSGVGGLSVCAYVERYLRKHGIEGRFRLTYVNASPENDYGYNSMPSRAEKLASFDRFLRIVATRYSPDLIFVACNTLSVLLADTAFVEQGHLPIRGIVETGMNRLLEELGRYPLSQVAIFATVTTIEEETFPTLLRDHGIDSGRIIVQACPSLADTISEDRRGSKAEEKIERYVQAALGTAFSAATEHLAYLGCTHYGYRKELFATAFEKREINMRILNPNELVAEDLLGALGRGSGDVRRDDDIEVEFVTRYRIPETAIETLSYFLEAISPRSVRALTRFSHLPDLF